MNDLLREHAPISTEAWREIDAEATRTLKTLLAARRLVDFEGPLGWATASVPTGRVDKLSPPLQEGAVTRLGRRGLARQRGHATARLAAADGAAGPV